MQQSRSYRRFDTAKVVVATLFALALILLLPSSALGAVPEGNPAVTSTLGL